MNLQRLSCSACQWTTLCDAEQMATWLRGVGMLRREAKPPRALVFALFEEATDRFTCPDCQMVGLQLGELETYRDEDWGQVRSCDGCGQPIAAERLEVFPDTEFCAGCQGKHDRGEADLPREFCGHCGGVMQTKFSAGRGVGRYKSRCSDCGRVG